jgi:hypothetical protein
MENPPDTTKRQRRTPQERRFPPLMISVVVRDSVTDKVERDSQKDFNDPSIRVWLEKLFVWAFHNGKSVEVLNSKDDSVRQS